jgi:hypothetical protein
MQKSVYPTTYTIANMAQYIQAIGDIRDEWENRCESDVEPSIWFRGHKDDYFLLPKALRIMGNPVDGDTFYFNEYYILNAFEALYGNYTTSSFEERSSEYFSFMQHYGIPTRLLDWTENALFALFFAVSEYDKVNVGNPLVWVLNPGALNSFTTGRLTFSPLIKSVRMIEARMALPGYVDFFGKLKRQDFCDDYPSFFSPNSVPLENPLAFYPKSGGNDRIATQRGCFTIHGTERKPIDTLFLEKEDKEHLLKLAIEQKAVGEISRVLGSLGITPRSVFPDMYGLSTELNGREFTRPFRTRPDEKDS